MVSLENWTAEVNQRSLELWPWNYQAPMKTKCVFIQRIWEIYLPVYALLRGHYLRAFFQIYPPSHQTSQMNKSDNSLWGLRIPQKITTTSPLNRFWVLLSSTSLPLKLSSPLRKHQKPQTPYLAVNCPWRAMPYTCNHLTMAMEMPYHIPRFATWMSWKYRKRDKRPCDPEIAILSDPCHQPRTHPDMTHLIAGTVLNNRPLPKFGYVPYPFPHIRMTLGQPWWDNVNVLNDALFEALSILVYLTRHRAGRWKSLSEIPAFNLWCHWIWGKWSWWSASKPRRQF